MKRIRNIVLTFILAGVCLGCSAVHEGTRKTGEVIGEGANAVGGLSEGGAGAVQGRTTDEENPYGR